MSARTPIVSGATPAPLVTAESPQALMSRLGADPPLAQLTRPDGTPVWVKGGAVSALRAPVPSEIPPPPDEANTIILLGGLHQAVQEDTATVRMIVNAHGGHL
jgi:hypothetical protein